MNGKERRFAQIIREILRKKLKRLRVLSRITLEEFNLIKRLKDATVDVISKIKQSYHEEGKDKRILKLIKL